MPLRNARSGRKTATSNVSSLQSDQFCRCRTWSTTDCFARTGDADPHTCQWDESGNIASPSECERCHRSCYCQDLEEDQCHHDEICMYDYSTHEAAATSARATTGRRRRYLQDVSAATCAPDHGFIPPEARAAYVAPPEPEMVPCCNCGSCFEFGGPVTESCGEEGVLCCGVAADGTPWFSQPHHDYCAAEFGMVSAGESRPSAEEEVVGGAPLTIPPPCVARELSESLQQVPGTLCVTVCLCKLLTWSAHWQTAGKSVTWISATSIMEKRGPRTRIARVRTATLNVTVRFRAKRAAMNTQNVSGSQRAHLMVL